MRRLRSRAGSQWKGIVMDSVSGHRIVVATLAALAVLVVACGGDNDDKAPPSAPAASQAPAVTTQPTAGSGAVEVTLKEWAVEPGSPTVAAGEVTFKVSNAGKVVGGQYLIRPTTNGPREFCPSWREAVPSAPWVT